VIDSALVNVLVQTINGWIQTQLFYYLTDEISNEERSQLIDAMRQNLTSYVTEFVPSQIEASCRAFVGNKARIYLTETVARLRRKAVSWLYKDALKKYKDDALRAIGDRLDLDFGGLRKARGAVAQVSADLLANAAEYDLVNLMNRLLEEGLEDPEELPVMELRLDQDLRSIVNLKTGREEGQSLDKARRLRLKMYRSGEVHFQIREDIFLILGADGSVDFLCSGPLSVDAQQMTMGLEEDSNIFVKNTMHIGHPGLDMKKITLDEDDVKEYNPGTVDGILTALAGGAMGELSTRQFIERVAWRYVAEKLGALVRSSGDTPGQQAWATSLQAAKLPGSPTYVASPPDGSVIGKTDASADHLKGN